MSKNKILIFNSSIKCEKSLPLKSKVINKTKLMNKIKMQRQRDEVVNKSVADISQRSIPLTENPINVKLKNSTVSLRN